MRIVHLEDDGPLREILAAALKATVPTCEIHQFMNSDDALRYATENAGEVDLFILDVRVPGSMNGLQVAEKLRAIPCLGMIVITSAYRAPDEVTLRKLGCEWYPKPWHIFEATTKLVSMAQRKPAAPPVTPSAPVTTAPDVTPTPSVSSTKPPTPDAGPTQPLAQPKSEASPTPPVSSARPPAPSAGTKPKAPPAAAPAASTPVVPPSSPMETLPPDDNVKPG
jgi:CheY-like chemotaxis protein